jgi:hypothetical protein
MGRFATLNDDTKDLVNCLLPALATSFNLSSAVDIIPEDIRMRAWDCDKRDHIKEITENDPRNWGVQFLKDLMAISRLKNGDLALFQADLRAKVALHEPKHPWARLGDIKELKDEYLHPNRPKVIEDESAGTSSTDSYLEELHEPELPRGMKRGRHEIYEARVQESHKRKKCRYTKLKHPHVLLTPIQMDLTAVSVAPRAASSAKTRSSMATAGAGTRASAPRQPAVARSYAVAAGPSSLTATNLLILVAPCPSSKTLHPRCPCLPARPASAPPSLTKSSLARNRSTSRRWLPSWNLQRQSSRPRA